MVKKIFSLQIFFENFSLSHSTFSSLTVPFNLGKNWQSQDIQNKQNIKILHDFENYSVT